MCQRFCYIFLKFNSVVTAVPGNGYYMNPLSIDEEVTQKDSDLLRVRLLKISRQ